MPEICDVGVTRIKRAVGMCNTCMSIGHMGEAAALALANPGAYSLHL